MQSIAGVEIIGALTNNKCCLYNNKLKMFGDGFLQNVTDNGVGCICRNIIQNKVGLAVRSILLASSFFYCGFYNCTFKRFKSTDHIQTGLYTRFLIYLLNFYYEPIKFTEQFCKTFTM